MNHREWFSLLITSLRLFQTLVLTTFNAIKLNVL